MRRRFAALAFAVLSSICLASLLAQDMPPPLDRPGRPELQEKLEAALKFYNSGEMDKAAATLDELLAKNPDSREALILREKVGLDKLVKTLKDPTVGPKMRILLRKASEEADRIGRDPATIQALMEKMGSENVVERWGAIRQLTAIGPFAVPYLLDAAFSDETPAAGSRKVGALIVLRNIGPAATPPLVVALRHADDTNAARIANMIADHPDARAVPALAALAEDASRPAFVREAATRALNLHLSAAKAAQPLATTGDEKKEPPKEPAGGKDKPQAASAAPARAAEAHFLLAQRYYYADPTLIELTPERERVIWRWNPQGKNFAEKLAFAQVPVAAYHRLMADELLLLGMKAAHDDDRLLELFVANSYMQSEEAGDNKELAALLRDVDTINESIGAAPLYAALGRALRDRNAPLARRCIEALRRVGDPRPPASNTLLTALTYPDKIVRVSAAETIMRLSPLGEFGGVEEVVRVVAVGLGARIRERVAILSTDEKLYRRLGQAISESGMTHELLKDTLEATKRVKEMAPPVNLLIIDARVEGMNAAVFVDGLVKDSRSAGLPMILLCAPGQLEKLRAETAGKVSAALPVEVDAANFKAAMVQALATSQIPAAEDIRENAALVQRLLGTLAQLPPGTKYPARGLSEVAAGLLKGQPDEVRRLVLKVIANLPGPGLRDRVFDIFINGSEAIETRREAGTALLRLLALEPNLTAEQRAALRKATADADETVRARAIHALAIAAAPLAEREAKLLEVGPKPAAATK